METTTDTDLTVIVPAYDEAETIAATIRSLQRQTARPASAGDLAPERSELRR